MSSQKPRTFADLRGKRALVTGASSGIGRAIALELAAAGSDVIVHYSQSQSRAEQVATECARFDVRSVALGFDFRNQDFDTFVQTAWQTWNGLEIWINNAGADLLTGPGAQLTYSEKLSQLWEVDVAGTVHLSRAVLTLMRAAGEGSIVNIGWDQADRGMEGESAELFSTAKNAIMGFTRSLAISAAPEVRVNCIAPGWIRTAWGETASEVWQTRVLAETPLRRWGEPEDIARLARFLVSDDAAYLTGQVINANGGAVR